jgi:predicted amidophosphoribosyltransferase
LIERYGSDHAIAWAGAADHYDGRMKDIIHSLKYERRRSIARPLGVLMRECGAELLRGADCVVPVPLHPRREYDRGFNQADDLAQQLGLKVMPLLKRIIFTQSQIELPKHQRKENVRNAFAVNKPKGVLPQGFNGDAGDNEPKGSLLQGLTRDSCGNEPLGSFPAIVVLVDDVSTTGATLEACARVLKDAGVKEVRALTAARVVAGSRHIATI